MVATKKNRPPRAVPRDLILDGAGTAESLAPILWSRCFAGRVRGRGFRRHEG